jgi:2-amino-4-hydroxy-6-hydroxymethyldihydropteridine diphosphokinase
MTRPPAIRLAAVGLGANLPSPVGQPRQTLLAAAADLSAAGRLVTQSSLYRTEPVGLAAQPPFVNAAVLLETALDPEPLLRFLLDVEERYGRRRARDLPKGPRSLDLDLLLVGDLVVGTPALTLPHPALAERRFVLEPLCEIAPQLRHPVLGKTLADLLAELPGEGPNRTAAVRRMEP